MAAPSPPPPPIPPLGGPAGTREFDAFFWFYVL